MAARAERAYELVRMISELKPEESQILTLYHVEGYKLEEVARKTGKNLNTVKTTLYRALEKMKKKGGAFFNE